MRTHPWNSIKHIVSPFICIPKRAPAGTGYASFLRCAAALTLLGIASGALPAAAAIPLFDDAPINGASYWTTSNSTSQASGPGYPVHSGASSIAIVAGNWGQAGLRVDRTTPSDLPYLEAWVYREAGSNGIFVIRHTTSTRLELDATNNAHWTIDGDPGHYAFTDDAWHLLRIDLVGVGLADTYIASFGVKGDAGDDTFFFDDVALVEEEPLGVVIPLFDDAPTNGTSYWNTSNSTAQLSGPGDPVKEGTGSIAVVAGSWGQAGLRVQLTTPAEAPFLEAWVYREAGSDGNFVIRHTSSTRLDLDATNNAYWTIDGDPGHYAFTDDAWHLLRIDLNGVGLADTYIASFGVKGGGGTDTFFFDEIAFTSGGEATDPEVPTGPPVAGDWTLILDENFDGDTLGDATWHVGQHWLGINGIAGNAGRDNITVQNGNLEILAEKRPLNFAGNSYAYASGEISTFQKFRQRYGYFEARIKYDAVTGVWPAFWLMPDRGTYGNASNTRESYLRFDVSGQTTPVASATLTVTVTTGNASGSFTVHRLTEHAWNEETVTWDTKPARDPAWFTQVNAPVASEQITVDVTDYVNAQITAGEPVGFALVDTYMRDRTIQFASKESTTPTQRPVLSLNGTPLSPTDDATVRAGSYASTNYGSAATLDVRDPWASTSSTFDGGMEMDIMESLGIWGPDVTQHALHWDGYGSEHQSASSSSFSIAPTANGFHVYGMLWEPGRIRFFVDGQLTWDYTGADVATVESYVILSLQMGGWGGNGAVQDTLLPARMYVDFVRVWTATAP